MFDIVEEFFDGSDLKTARQTTGAGSVSRFEARFAAGIQAGAQARFVSSGREALRWIFSTLPRESAVVLPAFLCAVVPQAVLDGGLKPLIVDCGQRLNVLDVGAYEHACGPQGDVSAIFIPHLFGFAAEAKGLVEFARRRSIMVIEDCAHALGAKELGTPVGSAGDYSIFSFNMDKPMSLAGGGMLVSGAGRLPLPSEVARPSTDDEFLSMEKILDHLYRTRREFCATEPAHAGLRRSIRSQSGSFLRHLRSLRQQIQDIAPTASVGALRAELGYILLQRYASVKEQRLDHYRRLYWLLSEHVEMIAAHDGAAPLRAKIVLRRRAASKIDSLAAALMRKGFVAGRFNWPDSLDQLPLSRNARIPKACVNARRLAADSLDLPIHQNMASSDIDRMAECVLEHVR